MSTHTYTLAPSATTLLTHAATSAPQDETFTTTHTLTFNATTGALHLPITYQRLAKPALETINTTSDNPSGGTWRITTPVPNDELTNINGITLTPDAENPTLTFTYTDTTPEQTYPIAPTEETPEETAQINRRVPINTTSRTRITTALHNSHNPALGDYWAPIRVNNPAAWAIGSSLVPNTRPNGVNLLTFTTTDGQDSITATDTVGTTTITLPAGYGNDTASHTVYASTIRTALICDITELGFTDSALHLYDSTGTLVATAPTYERPVSLQSTDTPENLSVSISGAAAKTIYTALNHTEADNIFLALDPEQNKAYIFNDASGIVEPLDEIQLATGDMDGDAMFFALPAATLLTRPGIELTLNSTRSPFGRHIVAATGDTHTITTYRQGHRENTLSVVRQAFTG